MIDGLDIRVRGIVQGVGFRPFVYRLARRYLVNGWVLNDLDGVFIHAEAESKLLDEFVEELHMNPPAAATVKELELKEVPLRDCTSFEIRDSQADDADEGTLVSADLATCDECLAELFDPANRRYRYPFINCTNCGPRFTIIDGLPYDRPQTSMAAFEMCPECAREYADVADRRFHAQPDACFECGPQVTWMEYGAQGEGLPESPGGGRSSLATSGRPQEGGAQPAREDDATHRRASSDAIFARAAQLLAHGGIVAVKGLGGFHLACDAGNERAVAELRRRKHRDGKAFAVMVADLAAAQAYCEVSDAEASLLQSPARPIVLLRKRAGVQLARGVADALPELGVMLPATPVQHLLLHDFKHAGGGDMLVMTSGNVHDEPIVTDDVRAIRVFEGIADAILGNDRPILSRYDDSVVRVLDLGVDARGARNEALQCIRRARGFAPVPIPMAQGARAPEARDSAGEVAGAGEGPGGAEAGAGEPGAAGGERAQSRAGQGATPAGPVVLAVGPEQKNTFAYCRDGQAYVSQHIGDLEDADVEDSWFESKGRFEALFGLAPDVLACDAHPEYLASKWARDQSARRGLPLVEVQHHHAHIASVLAEHGLFGPAIGIAFDGTGYGADGAIWGGEVLLSNRADYERFANFSYMPMPGGAASVKRPLRMAYGMLWAYDALDHPVAARVLDALGDEADLCAQMIEAGLNTPMTSSVGRLFDAVSALLGICEEPTYEGEAAILLDAVRADGPAADAESQSDRYTVTMAKNSATDASTAHDTSVVLLDAYPVVHAVLDDMSAGVPAETISLRFHNAIVNAIVQIAQVARALYDIRLVALSGGCFMNRYLTENAVRLLGEAGFTVALNAALPPNDGCISFGQAAIATAV